MDRGVIQTVFSNSLLHHLGYDPWFDRHLEVIGIDLKNPIQARCAQNQASLDR